MKKPHILIRPEDLTPEVLKAIQQRKKKGSQNCDCKMGYGPATVKLLHELLKAQRIHPQEQPDVRKHTRRD